MVKWERVENTFGILYLSLLISLQGGWGVERGLLCKVKVSLFLPCCFGRGKCLLEQLFQEVKCLQKESSK